MWKPVWYSYIKLINSSHQPSSSWSSVSKSSIEPAISSPAVVGNSCCLALWCDDVPAVTSRQCCWDFVASFLHLCCCSKLCNLDTSSLYCSISFSIPLFLSLYLWIFWKAKRNVQNYKCQILRLYFVFSGILKCHFLYFVERLDIRDNFPIKSTRYVI